jgi:hypothetical protein
VATAITSAATIYGANVFIGLHRKKLESRWEFPFAWRENILTFYFSAGADRLKEGSIRHGWLGRSAWLVRVDLVVDCAGLSSLALSKLSLALARLWI